MGSEESLGNLKMRKKNNWFKFIGIIISIFFIIIGVFILPLDNRKINAEPGIDIYSKLNVSKFGLSWDIEKRNLINSLLLKLEMALEERTKSSNPIHISYNERKVDDDWKNKIKKIIDDLENYINFEKNIKSANIFFLHIMRLIFILSGIAGLLAIIVWKSREEKDQREQLEQERVRCWELKKMKQEVLLSKSKPGD